MNSTLHPLHRIYYFDACSSNMGAHILKAAIFLALLFKTIHGLKVPVKKSRSKIVSLSNFFSKALFLYWLQGIANIFENLGKLSLVVTGRCPEQLYHLQLCFILDSSLWFFLCKEYILSNFSIKKKKLLSIRIFVRATLQLHTLK